MAFIKSFLKLIYAAILISETALSFGQCECLNETEYDVPTVTVCLLKSSEPALCHIKPRHNGVKDLGWAQYFHGWADVQGQGAANDYCRIIGYADELQLSCALAGHSDRSYDRNYNSSLFFDVGLNNTWYLKDEDGDGRDDYCRCIRHQGRHVTMCTKAGPLGFYGSDLQGGNTFTFIASETDCSKTTVRPEFGRT